MQYIDVVWVHENNQNPVRLVSELDEERFEVRKLEFFESGAVGYADGLSAPMGTQLSLVPVPELREINEDAQFKGTSMREHEFETLWRKHANKSA